MILKALNQGGDERMPGDGSQDITLVAHMLYLL
jgi:hypothetical protein